MYENNKRMIALTLRTHRVVAVKMPNDLWKTSEDLLH
jgi:hypothetical protein